MKKERMKKSMNPLSVLVFLGFTALSASANVTLNGLFSDHMVLQREMPVAVYGKADPGETVIVDFAGQEKVTTGDKTGCWSVKLDALKASKTAATMTVSGKNKVTLNDVLVGDVWVCSGQSNMEWSLRDCNRPDDIKDADFPLLRQFFVPCGLGKTPRADGTYNGNAWTTCSPQSAGNFTAVGFYFARKISSETGIPIGLIKSAWGGTRIQPWIPYSSMALVPQLANDKQILDNQIKAYVEALAAAEPRMSAYVAETKIALTKNGELPVPPELKSYPIGDAGAWGSIYNGMIHSLIGFPIKGVIWYQGESNGDEGDSYFHEMRALVLGWRKAWNQGDFPFYYVQLASFQNPNNNPQGGDGWARVRMAQNKALSIPNTGMAVAIDLADVGNPGDIHPKNKRDVGERLALWALVKNYGKKNLIYSGPLYKEIKVEGTKIRVFFDNVGSGLTVASKKGYDPVVKEPKGKLQKFAIAGEDKKWVWADAVIEGKAVVVSSLEVPKPVAVRYAFSMNPEGCNLYNNEGLPAAPFRTDDW